MVIMYRTTKNPEQPSTKITSKVMNMTVHRITFICLQTYMYKLIN